MGTSTNRRRTLGPTIAILLALNLGWLARLEVQAQQTNKLVEHHASLERGHDSLEGLGSFVRRTGDQWIGMDERALRMWAFQGRGSDEVQLSFDPGLFAATAGNVKPDLSGLLVKKDAARLQHNEDKIRISHEGVELIVNKGEHRMVLSGEALDVLLNEQSEQVGLSLSEKGVFSLLANAGATGGEAYALHIFPKQKLTLEFGEAKIEVAGPSAGSPSSIELQTRADINLKADGNITLEAPNGEIRINGRRIDLNERPGA